MILREMHSCSALYFFTVTRCSSLLQAYTVVDIGVCKHPCSNLPCWQIILTPIHFLQKDCICGRLFYESTWNFLNTHTHTAKWAKTWKQRPSHWAPWCGAVAVGEGMFPKQHVFSSCFPLYHEDLPKENIFRSIHQGNIVRVILALV